MQLWKKVDWTVVGFVFFRTRDGREGLGGFGRAGLGEGWDEMGDGAMEMLLLGGEGIVSCVFVLYHRLGRKVMVTCAVCLDLEEKGFKYHL